jgi:fructose-1,6-bisphosphatase/inositol monophosphatase family enzyme
MLLKFNVISNLNGQLAIAMEAARAGAEVAAKRFGQILNTRIKGNSHTLVTDADPEAEKAILNVLKSLFFLDDVSPG